MHKLRTYIYLSLLEGEHMLPLLKIRVMSPHEINPARGGTHAPALDPGHQ